MTFNESAFNALPRRAQRYVKGVMHDFRMLRPGPYVSTTTPDTPFLVAVALFAEKNPTVPVKYTGKNGIQCDIPPGLPWNKIDTPTHDGPWGDGEPGEEWKDEPWMGFDGKQVNL